MISMIIPMIFRHDQRRYPAGVASCWNAAMSWTHGWRRRRCTWRCRGTRGKPGESQGKQRKKGGLIGYLWIFAVIFCWIYGIWWDFRVISEWFHLETWGFYGIWWDSSKNNGSWIASNMVLSWDNGISMLTRGDLTKKHGDLSCGYFM